MRKGILARRSAAAGWCRLVGALAVPVLATAALGMRIGLVPSEAMIPTLALGFLLAFAALALGVYALKDIWHSGAEGAGAALAGIIYAMPAFALLAAISAAAVHFPRVNDVSTDPADPPALAGQREGADDGAAGAGPENAATPFADLTPRLYALPIGAVYAAIRNLAADRDWLVMADTPPLSMPIEPATPAATVPAEQTDAILDAKATITQSRAGEEAPAASPIGGAEPLPGNIPETAILQAVATTPVFGFADDVSIRLRASPTGTRVDMRSASQVGAHDLGQNARRIRRFLADLDVAVQPAPDASGSIPVAGAARPDGASR